MKKLFNKKFLCIFIFTILFFGSRVPRLNNDVINPDGVNWHYRSQQFINGIKYLQFIKTYQHYHPGVTLMWVAGPTIELYKQISDQKDYTVDNFSNFDFWVKFSLVVVQYFLTILIIFTLSKFVGFYKSFFTSLVFSFEPFFIGNSRLFHMDVLFSLFIFLSLIFLFNYLKTHKLVTGVLTGLFLSLSFLTKSIGIGVLVYAILICLIYGFVNSNFRVFFKKAVVLFISCVFFIFLMFPALWVKPAVLIEIFKEGERIGIRDGHSQVIMGEETQEAGPQFYPLVLAIKCTPVLLLGALLYFVFTLIHHKDHLKNIKSFIQVEKIHLSSFYIILSLFYIGYFVVMEIPSKKIDRYMLVMFPYLALLCVQGFDYVKTGNLVKKTSLVVMFLFYVVPLIYLFPYYFTYASPIFINSVNANKIIAQKPFGVAIYDLKKLIDAYGQGTKVGMYDVKPLKSIYPNSQVFDVRAYGPGKYDILVLAINEEMPSKVTKDVIKFEKTKTLFVNGLPFYDIYTKIK